MNLARHFLPLFQSSQWMKAAGLAMVMLLAGCGFQMRHETPMPFQSMYVGVAENSRFGADIRRAIRAASPDTRIVSDPKAAQAILQQLQNTRTLRDVALNAQGRVEEYELGLVFTFRLIDQSGRAIIPDTTFTVYRDMPYDDSIVQAKQAQMETLYEAMQQSLVNRLIRRLTAPDVAESVRKLEETKDNVEGDEPLFNPREAVPQRTPSPWNTPSITPGLGAQPE